MSTSPSTNIESPQREQITVEHELRLRRWAREYYVTAEKRSEAWHPVILNEMALKDYEESLLQPIDQPRYVPLEPSIERRFDQKHELRGPRFMRPANRQPTQERLYADIVPGEMYYT